MSSCEINEEIEEIEANTKEIRLDLNIEKKEIEEAKKTIEEAKQAIEDTFSGLKKKLESITGGIKKALTGVAEKTKAVFGDIKTSVATAISNAFAVTTIEEYTAATERFGEGLAGSLFSLQQNIAMLEASIVNAIAPIAGVVVPILNEALTAAIDFSTGIGQIVTVLFAGAKGTDVLTESAENAAAAAGNVVNILPSTINDTLSPQIQTIVDKMQALLLPLQQIDLSLALTSFANLQASLTPFTQELFTGLEWAYINIFTPLAMWTTEGFLPAFLETLGGAMTTVREVLAVLQPLGVWLWDSFLQPMADWTGGVITEVLQGLGDNLTNISTWISTNQALVEGIAIVIGSVATAMGLVNAAVGIWNVVSAIGAAIGGTFSAVMGAITSPITVVVAAIAALIAIVVLLVKNWDTVKEAVLSAWHAIQEAIGKAWQWVKDTLLDPLESGFKNMVNGVIGFINGMIAGIIRGINGVIEALNKLKFTVPDWVPGLGGQTLGFNLKTLTAPQIPYLAKGAVLPANKPFMAVVGDQRHGTNIEAPLTTIQEAVAGVMDNHIAAMMAGFNALLQEQIALRHTVESIELGDNTIAEAVERYHEKMSIVYGYGAG